MQQNFPFQGKSPKYFKYFPINSAAEKTASIFGRLILSQENKYKPDVPEPRGLGAYSTSNKRHSKFKNLLFSQAMKCESLASVTYSYEKYIRVHQIYVTSVLLTRRVNLLVFLFYILLYYKLVNSTICKDKHVNNWLYKLYISAFKADLFLCLNCTVHKPSRTVSCTMVLNPAFELCIIINFISYENINIFSSYVYSYICSNIVCR
jgi:hypothetical protein